MPTHCCLPLCTKKGCRVEVTDANISYFRFPTEVDSPETVDSPDKKGFGEEFLYIKFNQDFLKAFYG